MINILSVIDFPFANETEMAMHHWCNMRLDVLLYSQGNA